MKAKDCPAGCCGMFDPSSFIYCKSRHLLHNKQCKLRFTTFQDKEGGYFLVSCGCPHDAIPRDRLSSCICLGNVIFIKVLGIQLYPSIINYPALVIFQNWKGATRRPQPASRSSSRAYSSMILSYLNVHVTTLLVTLIITAHKYMASTHDKPNGILRIKLITFCNKRCLYFLHQSENND